jgi:hypothetical protein
MDVVDAAYLSAGLAPHSGEELADAVFSINDKKFSLGDYLPLKFINGDDTSRQSYVSQLVLNFAVAPGFATRHIKYLQLALVSMCEIDMNNLYRKPISFTRNIDPMSWEATCPKVQFDQTTVARYLSSSVSTQTSSVLNLVVNNPDAYNLWPDNRTHPSSDLMNLRLSFVRLQYRPVRGGEWITAKSDADAFKLDSNKYNYLCPYSRSDGCRFDWDTNGKYEKLLSGFKDGLYELRVKSFCTGASSLADLSVHEYVSEQRLLLNVDTVAPVRVRTFEEAQYYGVEYAEEIDCTGIEVSARKTSADCAASEATLDETVKVRDVRCSNSGGRGIFSVRFPDDAVGKFRVKVSGIKDMAGMSALPIDGTFHKCKAYGNTGNTTSAPVAATRLGRADDPIEHDERHASPELAATPMRHRDLALFAVVGAAFVFAGVLLRRRVAREAERDALVSAAADSTPSYGTAL